MFYSSKFLTRKISSDLSFTGICFRWAWSQVDKEGTGYVLHKDVTRLNITYREFLDRTDSVTRMIKQCDKNNDQDLEVSEIMELLEVCSM
jgi:Ca2+-binding EF-hand superfamily protein